MTVLTLTLPWFFEPGLQTCARSRSKIGGKNDCFGIGLSNILSFPWTQLKICMTGPLVGELFVSTLEETNRVISKFQKAMISKLIVRRLDKGFGAKGQCYCINLNGKL